MLAINIEDVINVLNSCKLYLIALGVILALVVVITIAVMKLPKPKKKFIRSQSWIAFLLAVVVIVNMICWGPMSSMISLATEKNDIQKETSDAATALCEQIADEGIVLLKNENGRLPLEEGTKLIAGCTRQLDQAEQQVVKLMKGAEGKPEELPFEEAEV